MTFGITSDQESGTQVVRLVGWLEGENVTHLERVVSDTSGPLRLDLTELRSADQDAVKLLRALQASGVSLVGASPFIRLLVGIDTCGGPEATRVSPAAGAS